MKFYGEDIAVVAYSGMVPGCDTEEELFQALLNGRCLIHDLSEDEGESPLQVRYHFSSDRRTPDATYSKFGTKFSFKKINEWAKRNNLDTKSSTTLEIILHELFRRLDEKVPGLFHNQRSECVIGVSTGETDPVRIGQRQFYEKIRDELDLSADERKRIDSFYATFSQNPDRNEFLRKDIFSSLICGSLRDKYALTGASAFVDAACASSLAAMMLALRRVREGERDVVITGGIDASAVLLTMFAFSKLQVMSEKIMNPFDRSADGMNQGEGAALFAFMRLQDAKERGYPIHGVIRNCDGSSDGALGGMVEPTEYGQNLAYERAYQEVPFHALTFLECHGTGTKLGDKTELSSTAKFFRPLPPIGSVKANVGHTIAAAGAVSLVKALKIIEQRVIPRMPNFKRMERGWSQHTIYSENQPLSVDDTIRIGISSFGFGGANYHMVVDEYRGEEIVANERRQEKDFQFLLNGVAEIDLAYVDELIAASRFKIPPVSLRYADPAILGSMLAVDKLLAGLGTKLSQKLKEKVGVISLSNSYLDRLSDCYERIGFLEVYRRLDPNRQTDALLKEHLPNDLTVTEDTFMWALNNLVAGRVTKDFDFKGPNFNLASEKASLGVALDHVQTILKGASGAYIILAFDEDVVPGDYRLKRSKVRALLVSDREFALTADLPIEREIKSIESPSRNERPKDRSSAEDVVWPIVGTDHSFDVTLCPYKGVDFSRQAFMFCGQGAMRAGVSIDGLDKLPIFQKRFRELDDLAHRMNAGKPSDYFTRPENELTGEERAVYSGLCLYSAQVSMFETLLMSGQFPKAMTAHSFGEFAQLTAAGVVSFADMVRFLIDRQRCLTEFDGRYTMFAVSHSTPLALSDLPCEVYPANYNTRFQTAFVCRDEDFAKVKTALREKKVACVKMNIDFPYHTPWLEPVRERLRRVLSDREISFHAPRIPFVSSVTHEWVNEVNFSPEMIRKLMVDQLITPVRFPDQIAKVRELGVYNFYEISPVDVLDDFVEQFFGERKERVKINSFRKNFQSAAATNKSYEKLKDSKFFGKLDAALKALTGYSVVQIRLEDRIREDLGIDSIKKAEIVFEIVDAMGDGSLVSPANLADLATFGDILEYFETSRALAPSLENARSLKKDAVFQRVLMNWRPLELVDYTSVKDSKVSRFNVTEIRSGQRELRAQPNEILVLDTQGYVSGADYLDEMKWWMRCLKHVDEFGSGVVVLHRGGSAADGLAGMLMSLSKERAFSIKIIELPDYVELSDSMINRERADFFHSRVRYENGIRLVRQYVPASLLNKKSIQFKKILAFGGLGGVGHQLLRSFAGSPADLLVIVGRTGADQISAQKLSALEDVAEKVIYESADLGSPGEARRYIQVIDEKFGPFDLVIHGVGTEISEPLEYIRESDIDRVMDGKVRLAEALVDYSKRHPKTRIILNSSIVSEFGSPGQCAYAAANAYLNKLSEGAANITTVLWPGWDGVGVASQKLNARSLKLQGVTLMQPDNGQAIFQTILAGAENRVAVLSPSSLADFSAIGQSRQEYSWLMKPASRDYALFVVPGLTQEKLPYLKDHLVKRACIFPASGSMAMMLFRAYLEKGELGNIRNFSAHNFLVVREQNSNVTLETTAMAGNGMSFQIKSHQLLATGEVEFVDLTPPEREFHFTCNQRGVTDYDQNVAVYTGPDFELAKESFLNSETDTLVLDVNLETAPVFIPIPLIDKVHRLIELCFNTSHAKALLTRNKFTVPKSIEAIDFFKSALIGHRFFTVIENLESDGPLFLCDIITLNEKGEPAIWVKGLRSIVVGDSKTATTKGYQLSDYKKTLF